MLKKRIAKVLFIGMCFAFIAAISGVNTSKAAELTAENDYMQGKVYKITPKTKPLKASKYRKSSLYNSKTNNYR